MSIKLHLTLMIAADVVLLVIAMALVLPLVLEWLDPSSIVLEAVCFMALALSALILPEILFRFLIPARCPKCKGPAFMKGRRPVSYACRACPHIERTGMYIGKRLG